MQALLSFDQAPPFAAPLRFFLTAPVFGVLAGVLLLAEGGDLFASRWTPGALALTHLLVLGFMLLVMLGALIQILPVVAGANVARPAKVAALSHALLVPGILCLVGGFLAQANAWLQLAAVLLLSGLLVFLVAAGRALFPVKATSPTIRGLKLALLGLSGAALFGAGLVQTLDSGSRFSLLAMVDLHAAWGLGAWSGVLLISVAYVVVPMFQLTPGYSARAGWWFPAAVFAVLIVWSVALFSGQPFVAELAQIGLGLAGLAFCVYTLRLQKQRRRAKFDATARYWQFGLLSSGAAMLLLLLAQFWSDLASSVSYPFVFASLLVVGGFISFINGMLYKIVPFLAWLHLQNQGQGQVMAPPMNKLLLEKVQLQQFYAHFACVQLLGAASFFPAELARLAGAALVLDMTWLGANLWQALRRYRTFALEIDQKLVVV